MIGAGRRDPSLDFVKGVLVLLMLVFHAGSLFLTDTLALWLLDGIFLNFVSGSWVFLSGYLVVLRYDKKMQSDEAGVRRRLMMRGAKIIGFYALLNAMIIGFGFRSRAPVDYDLSTIAHILFYGGGEVTSFGVLLGIGYLLFLAPFILFLQHKTGVFTWFVVIVTCGTSLLGIIIPPNMWLVLCGFAGMALGFSFDEGKIRQVLQDLTDRKLLLLFGLVGAVAHYALFLLWEFTRENLVVYLLGVISMITITYVSHRQSRSSWYFDERIRLIGRYSLACYVSQMAILWGIWWLTSSFAIPISFTLALAVSLGILILIVWLVDRLVCDHQAVRKIYSYAFQ